MIEQDHQEGERHVHIIRGKELASLATELSELLWKACENDVMAAMAVELEEPPLDKIDPRICKVLVQFGFQCGIYEFLRSQMEGDLVMAKEEPQQEKEAL